MGFKPWAFPIGTIGVKQNAPTWSSEAPIAGRKPSLKETSNRLRDDRLVVALSHSIGLGHTRQTTVSKKAFVLASFVDFAGVVGIENTNFTITLEVLNAQCPHCPSFWWGKCDATEKRYPES